MSIRDKYTKLEVFEHNNVADFIKVSLVIDQQSFEVYANTGLETAEFIQKMLVIAIERLIKNET